MTDQWEAITDAAHQVHTDGGRELARLVIAADDLIEKLEAEVAALRASLKVLDDEPTITVAEHVEICAFLGAHLPQAAAITKGQDDE